jgi:hypothetical protein
MLEIISSKVTATPGASGWVQVYEFTPEEVDKLHFRGQLFVILATKKIGGEIDTISSGREIIGKLHDEYYGSVSGVPFDALKNSVEKVITNFKDSWGEIEIVCSAFVNNIIYSAASGGSRVIISRDSALATILDSQNGSTITASGYPKVNDLILLGTKTFFEKVSMSEVKAGLDTGKPETASEMFIPLIHGDGSIGTSGALIMKFEDKKNIFIPPQVENQDPQVGNEKIETKSNDNGAFKQKVTGFFGNLGNRLPRKGIYIRTRMGDEATSQSRKLTFSVGIVLLVILLVSIGFGVRQKKVNDLKKEYQGILTSATDEVNQAISLASVSPDNSRQLFLDSEQKLTQIQALKVKDPKIDELQKKIEDSRAAILGEYAASPELFLDLGLLSSGFKGDEISSSGGQIYVLDKGEGRIVSIAADTKKSVVVAGPSVVENPLDMTSYEDNVFVLFSDGIYSVGSTGKTKIIDKTWAGDALISAFAGNLYVLDKSGNMIYRYSGNTDNTFGSPQNWLSASTKADFSGATSWGMNGAIYALYPNSKVLKYSLGSPQNFSITGVSPQIGNIDALFADPDNQYVYLLDRAGKRVVVIDKNGKYVAQYIDDQIAGATSLVASESQKEIILLTGDKLLSIEIKNIQ